MNWKVFFFVDALKKVSMWIFPVKVLSVSDTFFIANLPDIVIHSPYAQHFYLIEHSIFRLFFYDKQQEKNT